MKKHLWLIFWGMLTTFLSVSWIAGLFALTMAPEEIVSLAMVLSYADAGIKAVGYALIIWGLVGLRAEGEGFVSAAVMAGVSCLMLAMNIAAALNSGLLGGQFPLLISLVSTTALLLFHWLLFSAQLKLAAARRMEKLRGRMNLARWAGVAVYVAGIAAIMVAARLTALMGVIDPENMDVNAIAARMMGNTGEMLTLSAVSLGLGLLSLVAIVFMLFAQFSSAREFSKPQPQPQA